MFNFLDAYGAKFYFDRLRASENLLFDSHYNITESVLKNVFVVQQILEFTKNKKEIKTLDMGCGNMHLSRVIATLTNSLSIGFDPKINYRIRLRNYLFNFRQIKQGKKGRVKTYKMDHKTFFSKFNSITFDVVFDNCSVTHFDIKEEGVTNAGWVYTTEKVRNCLLPDGIFISATDVVIGRKTNFEFCFEEDLLELFTKTGFKIKVGANINVPKEFKQIENKFGELLELNFVRVPPPGTVDGQVLGILGFVASRGN